MVSSRSRTESQGGSLEAAQKILAHVEVTLEQANDETAALKAIGDLLSHRAEISHTHIEDLAFLPRSRSEALPKAERLAQDMPAVCSLLAPLLQLYCHKVQLVEWDTAEMTHEKSDTIHKLTLLRECISKIPPPFSDHRVIMQLLQTTSDALSKTSHQNV